MQQKEENPVFLLIKWAGRDKYYLYLAVLVAFFSGLCTAVPYFALYRLMDSVLTDTCTRQVIVQCALMAAAAVTARFTLFGLAGVLSHKGAYGALFRVGAW
ncbi:hypothetical protein LBYZC6_07200 [Lacrimispora brassicae]